jgi:primosomal protein N' (replication factor Y) (superfamily II helicase)
MSDPLAVLLPLPLDEPFDYALPEGVRVAPGDWVEVPFGPRLVIGVVWERTSAKAVATSRLRAITRRLEAPPMRRPLRQLIEHVAATSLAPLGSALKLAIAVPAALEPPTPRLGLLPAAGAERSPGLSARRLRVLETLGDRKPRTAAEIARKAGVSASVVQAMTGAGLLVPTPMPAPADDPPHGSVGQAIALSAAQAEAARALCERVAGGHGVTLLEGVPGAGKTEVYLEAAAAALERGRQVLVLLPEIALTSQVLERFARRFGRPPAVWHSELGAAARRRAWQRIAEGREPIVIGARSALFLPLPDLGLVVVDEEHDASFKQEDGVPYHARDMAIARARFEACPAILVSATPALDTAWTFGRIAEAPADVRMPDALLLPARHGGAAMPEVALIDLRRDRPPPGAWLAPELRATLSTTLAAGE